MNLSDYKSCNWKNFNIDSLIPEICKEEPCVLGVDEAGRGPVLGPMVYGVSFCPISREGDLKELGAADSKTLSEAKRDELFHLINTNNDYIGWSLEVISPLYISNCMYKRNKISLNEVSQSSAASLIRRVIDSGAKIQNVFVDTVGVPEKYEARLQELFPSLNITVSKKADALFPVVSAASICAKVARDKALKDWIFPEEIQLDKWGSGYPGDSVTKNFLINSLDPVFGFPSMVRFAWSTAVKIMDEKCFSVKWISDDLDSEEKKAPSVLQYFSKKRKASEEEEKEKKAAPQNTYASKRHFFFTDIRLERVETL